MTQENSHIHMMGGNGISVCGRGTARVGEEISFGIENVLLVPKSAINLLSVSQLIQSGMQILFKKSGAYVYENKKAILYMPESNGLYLISAKSALDSRLKNTPTIMQASGSNDGSRKIGDQ
ncbi:hypothetical protein GGF45_004444, partial [Coemansia sp. RSA 551]